MKRSLFTLSLIALSCMAMAQQQAAVSAKKQDSTPAPQQVANTGADSDAVSAKKQDAGPEKTPAPAQSSATEAPAVSGKKKPD